LHLVSKKLNYNCWLCTTLHRTTWSITFYKRLCVW